MSEKEINPKSLEALLKFCIQADDGKNLVDINPQEAKEKGEWLQKVLNDISVNVGQLMIDDINLLLKAIENNESSQEALNAIEQLQDITENLDFAKVFIQLDGLKVIKTLLIKNVGKLSIQAADLLAHVTQNDEFCQTNGINAGLVEILIEKINNSTVSGDMKKYIYALSCMIRNNDKGQKIFFDNSGVECLIKSIKNFNGVQSIKAVFLLYCLSNELNRCLINESQFDLMVNVLITIEDIEEELVEHLSNFLYFSLKSNQYLCEHAKKESKFQDWLKLHIKSTERKPEMLETNTHINEIFKLLN